MSNIGDDRRTHHRGHEGRASRLRRMSSCGQRRRESLGGAFRLSAPAPVSNAEPLPAGWVAQFRRGSRQLVVRGNTGSDSYDDAIEEAHAAAQEALDRVAMRALSYAVIEHSESEHIVWWTHRAVTTVRVFCVSDMGVSGSASAEVRDQHGNPVPQPQPPSLPWHESLRYFRFAQTTSDLFDAYRNMYLALEALLSDVVPQHLSGQGRPAEGERNWLRRALLQINAILPLAPYAPTSASNAVNAVLDDLYAGTRTRLFHSKSGRPVLLPHGAVSQKAVLESLERLSRLYLDLFGITVGFRRPARVMTSVGFEMSTRYATTAVISDDSSPEDLPNVSINPDGRSRFAPTTHRAEALTRSGLTFWLGEAQGPAISVAMPVIRRVGLEGPPGIRARGSSFRSPALTSH